MCLACLCAQGLREEGVDRVTELSNLLNGSFTKFAEAKEVEVKEAEAKAKVSTTSHPLRPSLLYQFDRAYLVKCALRRRTS